MQRAHEAWIESLLSGLPQQARATLFDLLGELKLATHSRLPVQ